MLPNKRLKLMARVDCGMNLSSARARQLGRTTFGGAALLLDIQGSSRMRSPRAAIAVLKWRRRTVPDKRLKLIPSLFHFTDRRNLDMIRKLGGLYPIASLNEMGVTVPAPGGNEWSRDADGMKGMDKYVHLCFRPTHPMEYIARQEGRIVDSVFLSVHPDILTWDGVRFTPDVSNKSGVASCTIVEALDMIDFEVLYSRTDWRDPVVWQRLSQAEKCEILVPKKIPLDMIRNLPNG